MINEKEQKPTFIYYPSFLFYQLDGAVANSIALISAKASLLFPPHVSGHALKEEQISGLLGLPNNPQRFLSVSHKHLTPADLPSGMPGI
jgi:hypothetical protein